MIKANQLDTSERRFRHILQLRVNDAQIRKIRQVSSAMGCSEGAAIRAMIDAVELADGLAGNSAEQFVGSGDSVRRG